MQARASHSKVGIRIFRVYEVDEKAIHPLYIASRLHPLNITDKRLKMKSLSLQGQ
ncbi:hypothetical protein RINTHH_15520 [Richelia intracellularis HH01]|uniref:Uncharacterized protein n=1 Tax=Richelia intracellularis HH01 TaxID=1165094 RepID=M1WZM6_9NOST|nr:hypothetical protein [Richelia intracellularis]CCH67707.1 hypothetical protein RINTHH_15520 [Richelia intracellularis HH01]